MAFMEKYTHGIDERNFVTKDLQACGNTADWTFQKSTGEKIEAGEKSWHKLREVYGPFSEHVHDPTFLLAWETSEGWGMIGLANLWWKLAVGGDSTIKGHGGKEWDGVTPSAFKFAYRKEGKEIKLASTEIYSDPSAALVQMLKRGMLKPEQLMG